MRPSVLLACACLVLGGLVGSLWTPFSGAQPSAEPLGAHLASDGDEEEVDDPTPPMAGILAHAQRRRQELVEGLVGAWQITEYRLGARALPADDLVGAMVFTPEHVSIVLHARQQRDFSQRFDFFVQAGVHRWRIDELERLQTSTILAHSNLSGDMVLESPFTPREFEVELMGDVASLIRPDGNRLVLQRMLGETFPEQTLELMRAARAGQQGVR